MNLIGMMLFQGWGVAVLVGVPSKDDAFKTHPMNFLNERTLKGTFFGNYKPKTDIPGVVEKYMNKVIIKLWSFFMPNRIISNVLIIGLMNRSWKLRNSSLTQCHSRRSTRPLITC